MIQLSHSAIQKYVSCPKSYELHYIKKIRTTEIGSALFFGKAIDAGVNHILLRKYTDITPEQRELLKTHTADKLFQNAMLKDELNGVVVDLPMNENVRYYKSDYTPELLSNGDMNLICSSDAAKEFEINNSNDILSFMEECHSIRKDHRVLDLSTQRLYNLVVWHCLFNKGLLMLEAFDRDIMPEIARVHEIQKKIELEDEDGNKVIGFVDFEATFQDGVRRIMDTKTSSKAYTDKNFVDSDQLPIYSQYLNNKEVGYAVIIKSPFKKAPIIHTQLLFSKIPEERIPKTFERVDQVLFSIKDSSFPENRDSCYQYGKKCSYYEYCRSGGQTMCGLVNLKGNE